MNKKYVADISGNPDDHKKLILYKWNGGDNQQFYIQHHNGKYIFVSASSGESVQIQGGSNDNGAKLHGSHKGHQSHEQFELIPCNNPQFAKKEAYFIRTHSGKTVDVSGGQCDNEAEIIQWDFNGNANQTWHIEKCE